MFLFILWELHTIFSAYLFPPTSPRSSHSASCLTGQISKLSRKSNPWRPVCVALLLGMGQGLSWSTADKLIITPLKKAVFLSHSSKYNSSSARTGTLCSPLFLYSVPFVWFELVWALCVPLWAFICASPLLCLGKVTSLSHPLLLSLKSLYPSSSLRGRTVIYTAHLGQRIMHILSKRLSCDGFNGWHPLPIHAI